MTELQKLDDSIVERLVIDGDLSNLAPRQRVEYYVHRCRWLGIDPGEEPFQLIRLNGKLKLYATKTCANALTRVNRLSVEIRSVVVDGDIIEVTARASDADGRFADDIGVVDMADSDNRKLGHANGRMKAVTKAKRRAVLALVGLGVLDDSELDGVRGAVRVTMDVGTGEIIDAPALAGPTDIPRGGPRCSGAGEPIARAIDGLVGEISEILGATKARVYRSAARAVIDDLTIYGGITPEPAALLIDDGLAVKAALEAKLAEERARPPAREPGDDGDEQEPRDPTDENAP